MRAMKGCKGSAEKSEPITRSLSRSKTSGEGSRLTAQTPTSIGALRICEFMRIAIGRSSKRWKAHHRLPYAALKCCRPLSVIAFFTSGTTPGREFSSDKCVHQFFEEQVDRTPDGVALVFEEELLAYAELNRRANQLAHYLRALGVSPMRGSICVERGFEMIVALLAVLKAGGAYVPLDPAYPVERLRFMIEDSQPLALLTQRHLARLFNDGPPSLPIHNLGETAAWEE